MIIMVGGVPCSGKSSLTRNILSELGSAVNVEPMTLFPCQKHGDILVIGRYVFDRGIASWVRHLLLNPIH
jgi:hypothetical protein